MDEVAGPNAKSYNRDEKKYVALPPDQKLRMHAFYNGDIETTEQTLRHFVVTLTEFKRGSTDAELETLKRELSALTDAAVLLDATLVQTRNELRSRIASMDANIAIDGFPGGATWVAYHIMRAIKAKLEGSNDELMAQSDSPTVTPGGTPRPSKYAPKAMEVRAINGTV